MKRIWGQFLSDAVVVLGLGSVVNVLNYLFVLLAARRLSTEDFGTCSALLACVTISLVVGNALQLRVTQTVAGGHTGPLKAYTRWILGRLVVVGIGCTLCVALFGGMVRGILHATAIEVALTSTAIIGILFFGFANGLTAGLRRLKSQAWIGFVVTAIKLALLAALLGLGWGTSGVLGAYAASVWLVLPLSLYLVRNAVPPAPCDDIAPEDRGSGALVFIAYLLITAPFMLDQILVQALAQPLSGRYGAAATLGKLVFYGCAPMMSVLFPYLVAHRDDSRMQLRYITLGGVFTLGGALFIAGILTVWSAFFVALFFPPTYEEIIPMVGPLALSVVLYVGAYFVTLVCIARGSHRVVFPLLVGLVVQVFLFLNRSDSLAELAENQLWGYGALFGALVIYLVPELLRMRCGEDVPLAQVVAPYRTKTLVYLHPHFTMAGGAGKYVLETGGRFARQGYTVVVISIRADDAIVGPYRKEIEFVDIGGPLSNSLWFWVLFPRSVWRVWRILRGYPDAIVFAQVFPANWWGFIYKLFHPQQLLVWMCQEPSAFIHSRAWIAALPRGGAAFCARVLNPLLRVIDVMLARRADLVFTNSRFGQRYAEEVYRFPAGRVVPTYLGVDTERFFPSPDAPQRQIVTVSRLTAFKRVDVILHALRIVHERGLRDLRLVIIGRGEAEEGLKELTRQLCLVDSVDFRGAVSDQELVEELRRSLALVLASVEEPFGLVAVEAMACGTPAIVTATGGPAETVLHGESGFLVPPEDPGALADHIELLCRNSELSFSLRKGAITRSRLFSWDQTVALSRRHIEGLRGVDSPITDDQKVQTVFVNEAL